MDSTEEITKDDAIFQHLSEIEAAKNEFINSWLSDGKKWKYEIARAMKCAKTESEKEQISKLIDNLNNPQLKERVRSEINKK